MAEDKIKKDFLVNADLALNDPSQNGVGGLSPLLNKIKRASRRLDESMKNDLGDLITPKSKEDLKVWQDAGISKGINQGINSEVNNPNVRPTDFGISQGGSVGDLDPGDVLANELSVWSKWASAGAKMNVLLGSTAIKSTVGLLNGIGESIYNMDISYMYRNTTNSFMTSVEEKFEQDWLPNYYTLEELDNPWYLNVGTANFWADGVVKNLGFTLGAAASGAAAAAGLRAVGASASVSLILGATYSAYSESNIEAEHLFNEMVENGSELEDNYIKKLGNDILKEAVEQNPERFFSALRGVYANDENSIIDSRGKIKGVERDEKGNPINDLEAAKERKYMKEAVLNGKIDYSKVSNDMLSKGTLEKLAALKEFESAGAEFTEALAKKAANTSAIAGTLFLYGPESFLYGKMFRGGFKSTRRVAKNISGTMAKEGDKIVGNFTLKGLKRKAALNLVKRGSAEAFEEGTQNTINQYGHNYYGDKVSTFYKHMTDPESTEELNSRLSALGTAIKDSWGDIDSYEELAMGFLTAMIPLPGINFNKRSRENAAKLNKNGKESWISWYGGILEVAQDHKDLKKLTEETIKYLNKRTLEFNEFVDGKMSSELAVNYMFNNNLEKKFSEEASEAVEEEDKYKFLNATHSNLIKDVIYFGNAGKLDVLENMIETMTDHSKLNLKDIVAMTSEIRPSDGRLVGPFADAQGNPLTLTEEGMELMKTKLDEHVKYLKETVKQYREVGETIDKHTDGVLSNTELAEMIWLGTSIKNWESRATKIHGDNDKKLRESVEVIQENIAQIAELESLIEGKEDSSELEESEKVIEKLRGLSELGSNLGRKDLNIVLRAVSSLLHLNPNSLLNLTEELAEFYKMVLGTIISNDLSKEGNITEDMSKEIDDLLRMGEDRKNFIGRYNSFLNDPSLITLNRTDIDKYNSIKEQLKSLKKGIKALGRSKTLAEFNRTALELSDFLPMVDELAHKGNEFAKNLLKKLGMMKEIGAFSAEVNLDDSNYTKEALDDELNQMMDNLMKSGEDLDALSTEKDSPEYQKLAETLLEGTLSEQEDDRNFLMDKLKELYEKYEKNTKWAEAFSERYKEFQENAKKTLEDSARNIAEGKKKNKKKKDIKDKKDKKDNKKEDKKPDNTDGKKDGFREADESDLKDAKSLKDLPQEVKDRLDSVKYLISRYTGKESIPEGMTPVQYLKLKVEEFLFAVEQMDNLDTVGDELTKFKLASLSSKLNNVKSVLNRFRAKELTVSATVDLLVGREDSLLEDPSKQTTKDVIEENEDSQNQSIDSAKISGKDKNYLYPALPEFKVNKLGEMIPFDKLNPSYKPLYDYLKDKKAFDYVNKGNLKLGDTIIFVVDKALNEKIGHKTILMLTLSGQIVGVLQATLAGGKVPGLTGLIERVNKEAENSTDEFVVTSLKTSVNSVLKGKHIFTDSDNRLDKVDNLNPNESLISVIKGGKMSMSNSKLSPGSVLDTSRKNGRVYLLVKDSRGNLVPIMLHVGSMLSVNAGSEAFKASETYKEMRLILESMAKSLDVLLLGKDRSRLSNLLYMDNIKINFRKGKNGQPFITVSKVKTDENGNPVMTYNSALGKEVRAELETKPIFLTNNGLAVSPSSIADMLEQRLIELDASFEVNSKMVNTPGYNARLINDGIITANITDAELKSAWFTTNLVIDGVETDMGKPDFKDPSQQQSTNIKGVPFQFSGNNYFIDGETLRDNKGTNIDNHPDRDLILDFYKAKLFYGETKNHPDIIGNVAKVPMLDRFIHLKRETYATEGEIEIWEIARDLKNKINLNNNKSQSTVDAIVENQKKIDKSRTDSEFYYVLEDDGQYHKYSRTTKYIGSNFVLSELVLKEIETVKDKIKEITLDGQEAHISLIEEFESSYGIDLSEFKKPLAIRDKQRLVQKIQDTLSNVLSLRATDAGTAVDSIVRDFFMNIPSDQIEKPDNLSETAFMDLMAELLIIKDKMIEDGETFLTNNIVLFHKYSNNTTDPSSIEKETPKISFRLGKTGNTLGKEFDDKIAVFKDGTNLFGIDVSGKSIEDSFKTIKKERNTEDLFEDIYLPLWEAWAGQNPESLDRLSATMKTHNLKSNKPKPGMDTAKAITKILELTYPDNVSKKLETGDEVRIAGEVDILSVDKDGNFKIYDIKTSSRSFWGTNEENTDPVTKYHTGFVNPYNAGQRSSYEQYTHQLSGYSNLFESQYGKPITGLKLIPFVLRYGKGDTNSLVLSLAKLKDIPIKYNPNVNIKKEEYKESKLTPIEKKEDAITNKFKDLSLISIDFKSIKGAIKAALDKLGKDTQEGLVVSKAIESLDKGRVSQNIYKVAGDSKGKLILKDLHSEYAHQSLLYKNLPAEATEEEQKTLAGKAADARNVLVDAALLAIEHTLKVKMISNSALVLKNKNVKEAKKKKEIKLEIKQEDKKEIKKEPEKKFENKPEKEVPPATNINTPKLNNNNALPNVLIKLSQAGIYNSMLFVDENGVIPGAPLDIEDLNEFYIKGEFEKFLNWADKIYLSDYSLNEKGLYYSMEIIGVDKDGNLKKFSKEIGPSQELDMTLKDVMGDLVKEKGAELEIGNETIPESLTENQRKNLTIFQNSKAKLDSAKDYKVIYKKEIPVPKSNIGVFETQLGEIFKAPMVYVGDFNGLPMHVAVIYGKIYRKSSDKKVKDSVNLSPSNVTISFESHLVFPNGKSVLIGKDDVHSGKIDEVSEKIAFNLSVYAHNLNKIISGKNTLIGDKINESKKTSNIVDNIIKASIDNVLANTVAEEVKDTSNPVSDNLNISDGSSTKGGKPNMPERSSGRERGRRRPSSDDMFLREVSSDKVVEEMNLDKEMEVLDRMLPQLSRENRILVLNSLAGIANNGKEAWGMFNKGVILLAEGAAKGTSYHEAFHYVSQSMMTSNERAMMYQSYMLENGNMSFLEVEESLAELFREYVEVRESGSLWDKFTNGFKRLVDFVRTYNKVKPYYQSVFTNIHKGKYAVLALNRINSTDNSLISKLKTEISPLMEGTRKLINSIEKLFKNLQKTNPELENSSEALLVKSFLYNLESIYKVQEKLHKIQEMRAPRLVKNSNIENLLSRVYESSILNLAEQAREIEGGFLDIMLGTTNTTNYLLGTLFGNSEILDRTTVEVLNSKNKRIFTKENVDGIIDNNSIFSTKLVIQVLLGAQSSNVLEVLNREYFGNREIIELIVERFVAKANSENKIIIDNLNINSLKNLGEIVETVDVEQTLFGQKLLPGNKVVNNNTLTLVELTATVSDVDTFGFNFNSFLESSKDFGNLTSQQKKDLTASGFSETVYNKMSKIEKEFALRCIGI